MQWVPSRSADVPAPSRFERAVAAAGIAVLLVLPCAIGTLSSILAILAAALLLPFVLRRRGPGALAAEPATTTMLAVFVVLVLIFVVTARAPHDVVYAANFLGLALAPVAFLEARSVSGAEFARLVARLCLGGAALGALVAMLEVQVLGHPRAAGLFGNPNVMPRLAIVIGFAALSGVWLVRSRERFLYYAGPVLAAVVVYYTGSRGAALALPVLGLVALACLLVDAGTRRHVPVLVAGVAILAAGIVLLGFGGRVAQIPSEIADALGGRADDFAIGQRMSMYGAAFEAFRLSPWIGQGWGNLGKAAAAVDPANLGWAANQYFMFHNDALNFAVAGGVVGIACWLALLAAPLLGAARVPPDGLGLPRLYVCLVLTCGFAVLGLTDMVLGYDVQTTLYAFLTGIVLGGFRSAAAPELTATSAGAAPAARR